jgi:hypothetical protein
MGCPAGIWRANPISFPCIAISGAGGMLTISSSGAFDVNYRHIQPVTFSYNDVKGPVQ